MPLIPKQNPLLRRLADSGTFGPGVSSSQIGATPQLDAAFARPSQIGVAPNVMQAGIAPAPAAAPAQAAPQPAMTFGGAIPTKQRNAAELTVPAVQVAGTLAGMQDQVPVARFQQRLMDAGINLNPEGQSAGDYQRNVNAAQGIYNNVFAAGMPQKPYGSDGPVQAFAPTGLRQRVLDANGTPVWGQGDVMVQSNGTNAQGGQSFSLGQVMPVGGPNAVPMAPLNPIAPSPVAPAIGAGAAPQQTQYQQNVDRFHQALAQSEQYKKMPNGYMIDPDKPGAVKPIPGGPQDVLAGQQKVRSAFAPLDYNVISANPAKIDPNSGAVVDSESHAQVQQLSSQLDAMSQPGSGAVMNDFLKVQDKLSKAQDDARAADVLARGKANALQLLDELLPRIDNTTAGWGSALAKIPGEARDVKESIEQIKSIFATEGLKTVKNVRNVREFDAIAKSVANLENIQSPDQLRRVVSRAHNFLVQEVGKDTYKQLQQQWATQNAPQGAPAAPQATPPAAPQGNSPAAAQPQSNGLPPGWTIKSP